jgi:hypothetical protein
MFEAVKRMLLIIAVYLLCCLLTGYSVLGLMTIADPRGAMEGFPLGFFMSVIIALFAALPASIFVSLAEHFSLRHWWIYSAFGAAAGLGIGSLMMVKPWFPFAGIGMGVVIGVVFWAAVGRNAGILKTHGNPKAQKLLFILLGVTALAAGVTFIPRLGGIYF